MCPALFVKIKDDDISLDITSILLHIKKLFGVVSVFGFAMGRLGLCSQNKSKGACLHRNMPGNPVKKIIIDCRNTSQLSPVIF